MLGGADSRWVDCVTTSNPAQERILIKYLILIKLTDIEQQTEIPGLPKLAIVRLAADKKTDSK